jgi:hypothetical protein
MQNYGICSTSASRRWVFSSKDDSSNNLKTIDENDDKFNRKYYSIFTYIIVVIEVEQRAFPLPYITIDNIMVHKKNYQVGLVYLFAPINEV